jgi:CBS-domain-containing membrane protein
MPFLAAITWSLSKIRPRLREFGESDLTKAVRHMEKLQVRRLPVINKSKRMVGILSLGDVSNSAPGDLLSECVKSVSAHH